MSTDLSRRATRRAVTRTTAVVFFVAALLPLFGAHYYGLDLSYVDLGLLCEIDKLLGSGDGLWLSPHLGRGSPLLANPHAQLFYPFRWFAVLLPPDWGSSLGVVLHMAGAAGAATWLARTFHLRPTAAALAGVTFACTGTVIDLIVHQSYLVTAVYAPLAWASARAFLHPRGRPSHVVMLCAALALCLLGGDPQGFGMAAGLALLEGVYRLRRARLRKLAMMIAAVVIAVAIASVQLLPTLAEAGLSGRLDVLNLDTVLAMSLDIPLALTLVIPVSLHTAVSPGISLYQSLTNAMGPWNAHAYLGLLLTAAALAAISRRRMRSATIVVVGGLLCALGENTFVYPLLVKTVPGLAMFRYPAKYLVVVTLAAVVLGFATLATSARARRAPRRFGATLLAALGLALAGVAWLYWRAPPASGAALGSEVSEALPSYFTVLANGLLVSAAPVFLALLLLRSGALRRYLPVLGLCSVALPAIGFVQAGPTVLDARSIASEAGVEPGAVVCIDERLRTTSLAVSGETSSWNTLLHHYALGVWELSACHSYTSGAPYSPLNSDIEHTLDKELRVDRIRVAQALGCEVVIGPGAPAPGRALGLAVVPVVGAIADAFVLERPRYASPDEIVDAIFAGDKPFLELVDDPRGTDPPVTLPTTSGAHLLAFGMPGPDQIDVTLGGSGAAVVAFRQSYRMGWHASQGGKALPIVRVSGTLLGVVIDDVTRGPVLVRYRPLRLSAGVAVTLAGLAALLGLWYLGRRCS